VIQSQADCLFEPIGYEQRLKKNKRKKKIASL